MQTSGIFNPRRLGHVNLWVTDLARSEAFYRDKCGLAVEFREPDLKASFLGTGATPHDLGMIEITKGEDRIGRDGNVQIPKTVGTAVGLGHLALEMESEAALVDACTRARAQGVAINRTADHQIARSAYLSDPDGNTVEFYSDTVKDWRSVAQGDVELLTSQWDPWAEKPSDSRNYHDSSKPLPTPNALVQPTRMAYVTLTTNNVERMADFYENIAGLNRVFSSYDGWLVCLAGPATSGGFDVAICRRSADTTPKYHHVSFYLKDDDVIEDAERRLTDAGYPIEQRVSTDSKRSLFIRDPDGMMIEFQVRHNKPHPTGPKDASQGLDRVYLI